MVLKADKKFRKTLQIQWLLKEIGVRKLRLFGHPFEILILGIGLCAVFVVGLYFAHQSGDPVTSTST